MRIRPQETCQDVVETFVRRVSPGCHRNKVQAPCCINRAPSGVCRQWIRRYKGLPRGLAASMELVLRHGT